jgi:hypothetical protein
MYILKVSTQIGQVFDGLSDSVTDQYEARVACLCTILMNEMQALWLWSE